MRIEFLTTILKLNHLCDHTKWCEALELPVSVMLLPLAAQNKKKIFRKINNKQNKDIKVRIVQTNII